MAHSMIFVGVRLGKFMASKAVSLSLVFRPRAISAKVVFASRDYLKVVRVYTPAIPAKVVDCESVRDFFARPFIGNAMSKSIVVPVKPETRVAIVRMAISDPFPTAVFQTLNLSGELKKTRLIGRGNELDKNLWVKFFESTLAAVVSVIGILAWNATVIQSVARVWQRIKLGCLFFQSASFARLFHNSIIPEQIRTSNRLNNRLAYFERAKEALA